MTDVFSQWEMASYSHQPFQSQAVTCSYLHSYTYLISLIKKVSDFSFTMTRMESNTVYTIIALFS